MPLKFSKIKGFYAIVDDSFPDPAATAYMIISSGCRLMQFRSKKLPASDILNIAIEIRKIAQHFGATFILNDRVDIALCANADGVHLGQEDIPLPEARKLIGKEKIVGISTHNRMEALEAQSNGADYIGFGPVFPTKTKLDARHHKGIEALEEITKGAVVPVVAIGGINIANIDSVFRAGAGAAALISGIAEADDIKEATKRIIRIVEADK